MSKKCCVVGLGYIGLPTAAILASSGYEVVGVDIDQAVVHTINSGRVHIIEPDLDQAVASAICSGSLRASTEPVEADIFVIAVPTPFKSTSSLIPEPDLKYVLSAVSSVSKYIRQGNLLIVESTCPVGTTLRVRKELEGFLGFDPELLHIAYCPERVLPGKIMSELISNDRVVGGLTPEASTRARDFYASFSTGMVYKTTAEAAELIKLTENSFRDVNIAFANELSIVCDELDIDTYEVIRLANKHPRVNILNPGCGVGGHCIAVDPWFIAHAIPDKTHLIQAARKVNLGKQTWVEDKILSQVKSLESRMDRKPIVGLFGLTFKPDIDDLRESPALHIAQAIIDKHGHASTLVCEPNISELDDIKLHDLEYVSDNADILVFLVSHSAFMDLDLTTKNIIDFCGLITNV